MNWVTIEVFDGGTPAAAWLRAWHDSLVETAVTSGARFWDEHEHRWGVVLEFVFDEEIQRDGFRDSPAVRAALDAAPDPVNAGAGLPAPRWRQRLPAAPPSAPPGRRPDGGPAGAGPGRRTGAAVHALRGARRRPRPQLVSIPPSTGRVVPVT
ncbi:hypothetical protein [Blastococcus saxobsidens]|uniref:hypothetical protein n=1 Tax=Blastococcus saxobsidens TaxID=138336 RepID=UPI001A91968B|nr:hypothetical protein [Blastococcus saxobsidens]